MRLAMLMVVRDEADLVGENLLYHAAQGVDGFVVTDHGSVDGTGELLEALQDDLDLVLLEERQEAFEQDRWMTAMLDVARRRLGADWVVLNDADEFWVPLEGSLADVAAAAPAGVLDCPRQTVLPDREALARPDYRFFHNPWRVARPFPPHSPRPSADDPLDWPLFFREIPGKVMCALDGLESVGFGNHDVRHASQGRAAGAVRILHYPVRNFERFRHQTVRHGWAVARRTVVDLSLSWHQRRLYALWEEDLLEAFYERLLDEVEEFRSGPEARLELERTLWRALAPATAPAD